MSTPSLQLLHRLGALNLYSARRPERFYSFDLRTREDREVCKVLVALALAEPGENWIDERYKREAAMDWVAGWELPKEWEAEDPADPSTGVRSYGFLELVYVAARPDAAARRALNRRFLSGAPRAF